jgi:hypothetical protein
VVDPIPGAKSGRTYSYLVDVQYIYRHYRSKPTKTSKISLLPSLLASLLCVTLNVSPGYRLLSVFLDFQAVDLALNTDQSKKLNYIVELLESIYNIYPLSWWPRAFLFSARAGEAAKKDCYNVYRHYERQRR